MKRINISIVSFHGYQLYDNKNKNPFIGGSEIQLYLLSNELIKNKNFNINFITGYRESRKILYNSNLKVFEIIPTRRNLINFLRGFLNFFFIIIKIRPDIVIQRAGGYLTGLCAFYKIIFNKKFIFSIAHKVDVTKKGHIGINGFFYRFGLKFSNLIIAQSDNQIRNLRAWKKNLPSCININTGYPIKKQEKIKKNYILWVGKAARFKQPDIFLNLVKMFPKQKFVMICNKNNNLQYWNFIYRKSKMYENLKFIEYIPFNKINEFFKNAKIFINTSTEEGFPNTFVQSFINEVPVISLKVNPDNILTNFKIGLYCENDFENLRSNLKILLTDVTLYNTMSVNCLIYAKNYHNIIETTKLWEKSILDYFK